MQPFERLRQLFVVPGEATKPRRPALTALHHPAPWGCGSFETTHFDFFNSRLRYLQGRDTPHSGISGDARVPVVCETANILQSHRWSEANATLTPPPHFAGANVPRSGPCDL